MWRREAPFVKGEIYCVARHPMPVLGIYTPLPETIARHVPNGRLLFRSFSAGCGAVWLQAPAGARAVAVCLPG
ncbi:hypothetical protein IMZ48_23460 [Candidatus Bathyarchaeota archaeon]|nr:hypothetical protein [Candidatus Bathyarchaeota archaeon]